MRLVRLALCGLLFYASAAFAADDRGSFAMKGAGFLTCKKFVAEREKKSNIYYMIGGWLDGYITAYNKYVDDTYDITSFESLELLLRLMQNHCQSNPNDRLYPVINSIVETLNPARLQRGSPRVEIRVSDRKTVLYRETIRRIQTELTRRGLYKGALDGRFTDATRSALIAFQSDINFTTTGFPDQATLWRLLRKPTPAEPKAP
jgi:Putative peptidoglycan binding domain